ncbi:caspase family protein [Paraclostridium sordellii]|uniref:caspase family protein n=1 Tax=Paraclostridium sordellii TaxID=1505 RepID=UPI0005EA5088|nr:caspase family protein [Paeniclostridium sordellii]CEN87630.1 peptidase C14 caspase catalytic subunit p20 [[Clostridium] sordellii] [Paeniclostridium sordellii]
MSKKALLIGNKEYEGDDFEELNLPENDVRQLKDTLQIIGFEVLDKYNLKFNDMKNIISEFIGSINDGDEIIFYFSGHGYSYKGNNYILPIDCLDIIKINDLNVFKNGYSEAAKVIDVSSIVSDLKSNKNGINILLLDACRKEYKDKKYKSDKISYFTEISTYEASCFISYATALGKYSYENKNAKCSNYIDAICNVIYRKDQTLEEMFQCVRNFIKSTADYEINESEQRPCYVNSLNSSYSLINNDNYTPYLENKYFKDLFKIYKCLLRCYPEDGIDDEEKFNEALEFAKMELFYPQEILEKYMRKFIKGTEAKLGIINFILEDDNVRDVSVFRDRIFINRNFNIKNFDKEYYNFDDCIKFIEGLEAKSEELLYKVYYYNKKNIIVINASNEVSFQIIGNSKQANLYDLIHNPIKLISKDDKGKHITDTIIKYIKDKKNILLLGAYDTLKEDMVSAFSNYFRINDKILNIVEDIDIDIKYGQVDKLSSDVDSILQKDDREYYDYIKKVKEKKFDRILYPYKSFRHVRHERKILEDLLDIKDSQLIIYMDHKSDYFGENLNKNTISHYGDFIYKADLVIYISKICAIENSIVKCIYEKVNNEIKRSIVVDIDYIKLGRINQKECSKK